MYPVRIPYKSRLIFYFGHKSHIRFGTRQVQEISIIWQCIEPRQFRIFPGDFLLCHQIVLMNRIWHDKSETLQIERTLEPLESHPFAQHEL